MFNKIIKLGSSYIGSGKPAYIVAEISCNHNNSIDKALELVKHAKAIGANAVKLQTYRADSLTLDCDKNDFRICSSSPWSEYETLYSLFDRVAMPWAWHEALFQEARRLGIDIFSSPFCLDSVELLERYGTDAYKIASPEVYHYDLIASCMKKGRPLIVSLGVADLADTLEIANLAYKLNFKDLIFLKCLASYPASLGKLNLATIRHLENRFGCVVGFSDHTIGYEADVVAVAAGAKIIEKHIRLDDDQGVDSFFSTSVSDFRVMVEKIREAESILGLVDYSIPEDVKTDYRGRRSLYFSKSLTKNELITEDCLAVVRPSRGLNPRYKKFVVNRRSLIDVEPGDRVDLKRVDGSRVKVSIVGLGSIGMGDGITGLDDGITTHLSYIVSDPRFQLITGVDPLLTRRTMLTEQVGVPSYSCLKDAEDLVAESDIIIFSEPTAFRAQNVIFCAERFSGKIFILEKPVSLDIIEARDISQALSNSGNKTYVNYQRRVNPYFRMLRDLIQNSEDIQISCRHTGTFLNIGTHFLDLFLFLVGDGSFRREEIINSGVCIYTTNAGRLILEEISGMDCYTMSISCSTHHIDIDFILGQVSITERDTLVNTNMMLDDRYYFRYVGDELIRLHITGECNMTTFERAISYMEY